MSGGLHVLGQHFPVELLEGRSARKSCLGKQNHATPIEALMSAHFMYRVKGESLWPYKCSFCVCWHAGHLPYKVRFFIASLLGAKAPRAKKTPFTVEETAALKRLWSR